MVRYEYFHTVIDVCVDAVYELKPPEVSPPLLVFSGHQWCHGYDTECALVNQSTDHVLDNSFFVFSGMALAAGGPASLLISEVLAQIVTYCATESLSEMNSFQPAGSFINFTYLYLDPAWSFAVGWIYAIRSMISISFAVASTARLLNVYLPSLGISTWVGILLSCILVFMFVQTKIMAQLAAIAGVTKALGLLGFT